MYLDYFLYSVFVELYGDPRRLGAPPGEAGHTNDLANQGTTGVPNQRPRSSCTACLSRSTSRAGRWGQLEVRRRG